MLQRFKTSIIDFESNILSKVLSEVPRQFRLKLLGCPGECYHWASSNPGIPNVNSISVAKFEQILPLYFCLPLLYSFYSLFYSIVSLFLFSLSLLFFLFSSILPLSFSMPTSPPPRIFNQLGSFLLSKCRGCARKSSLKIDSPIARASCSLKLGRMGRSL